MTSSPRRLLALLAAPLLLGTSLRADPVVAAVSSQAYEGYVRAKNPDGTFATETYTFGVGGHLVGSTRDDSIDKMPFVDLAKIIAVPLAEQGYFPQGDQDPNATKFLILVYWGRTNGTEGASDSSSYQDTQAKQTGAPPPPPPPPTQGPTHVSPSAGQITAVSQAERVDSYSNALAGVSAENNQRDRSDLSNAELLGYDQAIADTSGLEYTALRMKHDDLINEIEENRYFVVMMAYDFQELWKHKVHKLVWVTRLSVRERGTDFTKVLPEMIKQGSKYFGQDSHGLLRKPLPEGKVDIGEIKNLGTVTPEK